MCTDLNGNLYAISTVGNEPVYADTFYSAAAYANDHDFLISSYTCTGQMRWAKLISSTSGPCDPYGIVADSLGNIYVAGALANGTLHIGTDTSITGLIYERTGIIQFNTSGHFNWIRYVGANDINSYDQTGSFSALALDGSGNAHLFTYMGSNVTVMPGNVSHYGEYDLSYNTTGTLLSAVRLNMDSAWEVNAAVFNPVTNILYVSGIRNQYLPGGDPIAASYAGAFDANRNLEWMDTIGNNAGGFGSVVYDKMGHLYFGGGGTDSFTLNGYFVPAGDNSLIAKMDTVGKPMWVHRFHTTSSAAGISQITLLPNNLVAAIGIIGGTMTDGVNTITTPAGEGDNPFLTVLDTSGVVMSLLQIHSDGFYDWGLSITSDKVGNIYAGGQVEDSIYATNVPAYHSVGGNTDFFIMKYGMDCDCTSMPVANYTDTGAHAIKGFTYTGTTTGVDSVVWNFGDNSATVNTMSNVTHTYDTGTYEACVYAYSACGMDMHCSRVVATPSNEGVTIIENLGVSVYPNPAKDELNISTPSSGISYRLLSITGVSLTNGALQQGNNNVSLNGFASGMYILEMKGDDGQVKVVRVVKE